MTGVTPIDPGAVARVLIVRTDKIGDLLVSTPAIRCIREALPSARITMVASKYNAPVMANSPRIDELLVFNPSWSLPRKLRFWRSVRARRFDLAVGLAPITSTYVVVLASGAPVRAGMVYSDRPVPYLFSPLVMTHRHVPDHTAEVPHEARRMLSMLELLGLPTREHPQEVIPDHADLHSARKILGYE